MFKKRSKLKNLYDVVARTKNCIRRRNIIVRKQLKRKRAGILFQILQILRTHMTASMSEHVV